MSRTITLPAVLALAWGGFVGVASGASDPVVDLGRLIFFDTSLSEPPGQACARCHSPAAGWTGDTSAINAGPVVYPGAVHGRAGNRKPPSSAYATQSPLFHFDAKEQHFVGGSFWDGRATGWLLGNPVADQAQEPFLNAVEQNNPGAKAVVDKVCKGGYGDLFRRTYGTGICRDSTDAYNAIAQALAAFQGSADVNAFSSKYDHYLKDPVKYPLSEIELRGLRLFEDDKKGKCAGCHPSRPAADGTPPLFTDFTYDNLGIPKYPQNPWYRMPKKFNPAGPGWIDTGLAGFVGSVPRYAEHAADSRGKHKVPTLRNVDKRPDPGFVKAYGHNGFFKSLKEIVHFYNTRDVLPTCAHNRGGKPSRGCWPVPEVTDNLNKDELGNLGLSDDEEEAIVAFMKTLSDGWSP